MFSLFPILLQSCNGCASLGGLEDKHLRIWLEGENPTEQFIALVLTWDPGSGCPSLDGATVTFDGVPMDLESAGGDDEKLGCIAKARWKLDRSLVPAGNPDKEVVLTKGTEALHWTFHAPLRQRHLSPRAPVATLAPGARIELDVQDGLPATGAAAVLFPPEDSGGDTIVLDTVTVGALVTVTLPADLTPGSYLLRVHAGYDPSVDCPVDSCTATAGAQFAHAIEVQ